jgi:hypothetical protein
LKNDVAIEFYKNIPSDLEKISKEQWEWILYAGHDENQAQFEAQKKFLTCFYRFGFQPETNQASLYMYQQCNLKIDPLLKEFKYLRKYLKPITYVGEETGICINVSGLDGLEKDTYSVLYIHEDNSVVLYKTSYQQRKFKNFEEFLKWYEIEIKRLDKERNMLPF